MRRGAKAADRQAFEHVANIADQRPTDRRRLDPAGGRSNLKPPVVVLRQQREKAIVGMLADTPGRGL